MRLTSRSSGKCLDVADESTADKAVIVQWSCTGGANQQWRRGWPPDFSRTSRGGRQDGASSPPRPPAPRPSPSGRRPEGSRHVPRAPGPSTDQPPVFRAGGCAAWVVSL
ncbi:RICIN domain-containing protein [Streptomyces sparsogenes]|uniref:RICIN domain-containing protein n=1 Tax=Streptomyces sparsogenes TaxID=67365 RepID=UPI003F4D2C31